MATKLTWNPQPAIEKIYTKMAEAAVLTANEVAEAARSKAPIRKARSQHPGAANPVKVRPRRQAEFKDNPADFQRIQDIRANPGGTPLGIGEARFFKITEGPNAGKSPDELTETKRGAIRGIVNPQPGGNLRSKIHATAVARDGYRIIASVRSEAPYSAPVEFGYHGAGRARSSDHGEVPFMRPALEGARAGWNSGSKVKKG